MKKILVPLFLICMLVTACSEKKDAPARTEGPNLTQTPDVGKVEQVTVKTKGMGVTPGAAVNDALKTAIMQVNGVKVASNAVNVNSLRKVTADLDVETADGKDSAKATTVVQGQAFAEAIVSQSRGLVSSFRVLDIEQTGNNTYSVEIEAQIARFKAPEDAGKIKIVVAPLRSETPTFDIGGRQVPAEQILSPVRQQIIDSLTQTGRFTVLDRQFEGELQNELDMIGSGQTVNTDFAKLGQALSADIVWVGVVNTLGYNKHVRKLQTSDRSLVSYSGGWSVSQRLINLATRQILQSNTLEGTPPSIAPTTLGANFNEHAILKNMESEIAKKATEAIIQQTFPVSVVQRDGNNVVLSQGGQAVRQNGRYMLYLQGKEIKDPQTGQSLGNMETPCGEVVITRVTPKLSYGILENVSMDLSNVQPGALLVKEEIPASISKAREPSARTDTGTGEQVPPAAPAQVEKKPKKQVVKVKSRAADDDDW